MSFRLLVTGAGGFVAGSIIRQAPETWEIHAVSRSAAPVEKPGLTWHTLEPLHGPALASVFEVVRPTAVIHTAAAADIDFCEANQGLARTLNVEFVRRLVTLCRGHDARLVHLSTDNVFDGTRGRYREDDAPHPINFYGRTKVEAEAAAAEAGNALIARVALVMGLPMIGTGNSFLSRMRSAWAEGRKVGVPSTEIRSPIDVVTLGHALLELAAGDLQGVIHLAGNDVLNRYDMAVRIAQALGYSPALVESHDPTDIPGRAPRPRDVSLDNAKARVTLATPMRNLEEGIALILSFAAT